MTFLVETFFSLHKSCPRAKLLEGEFQWYVCRVNVYGRQLPAGDRSPSVAYGVMATGRSAAIPRFLDSLLCDRRKAHLNSLFLPLLIKDEEGHLVLFEAVQAPRKFMIRPPAWKVSWLDFAFLSSESSELNSLEPSKTEILLWPK